MAFRDLRSIGEMFRELSTADLAAAHYDAYQRKLAYKREWYRFNRQRVCAHQRKYYRANVERITAYDRARHSTDEHRAKRRAAHKPGTTAAQRAWYERVKQTRGVR